MSEEAKIKPTKRPIPSVAYYDYLDGDYLKKFLDSFGQIKARKKTGLTQTQQKSLALAVKRARVLAVLPFVTEYVDNGGGNRFGRERFNRNHDGPTAPSSARY
jgi:small subunit ribosomal protein S18